MPVHGYACNNFAKYFFNIPKALGIVFPIHPLILSEGWILPEYFDFDIKVSQIFCNVAKLRNLIFPDKILP